MTQLLTKFNKWASVIETSCLHSKILRILMTLIIKEVGVVPNIDCRGTRIRACHHRGITITSTKMSKVQSIRAN